MANRKKNKLDIYAETRLWNLKLKNRNMTTKDLAEEMIFRFHLGDTGECDPGFKKNNSCGPAAGHAAANPNEKKHYILGIQAFFAGKSGGPVGSEGMAHGKKFCRRV